VQEEILGIIGMDFVLHCYFHGLPYFQCISTSNNHRMLRGTQSNKGPFPPVAIIE